MQRFLLDTHEFLWWLIDDAQLGEKCKAFTQDELNDVFVSAATTWEMSIKSALGKLQAPEDMDAIVEDEGFGKLPVSLYRGQLAGSLPLLHRDPFDRMLIAQAQAEGLILITEGADIAGYALRIREMTKR